MKGLRARTADRSGFTLVDITVAVSILAIGLLGLAAMAGTVGRQMRLSVLDTRLALMAGSEMERLLADDLAALSSGTRRQGDYAVSWDVTGSGPREVRVVASYRDGDLERADTLTTLVSGGPR